MVLLYVRFLRTLTILTTIASALFIQSCRPPEASEHAGNGSAVYRDEVRFGLTFEERMAIPPALTRLKSEASRRADELYDPFRSRENAVQNEETVLRLFTESKQALLAEHGLTEDQLDEIIREYQESLGANLR